MKIKCLYYSRTLICKVPKLILYELNLKIMRMFTDLICKLILNEPLRSRLDKQLILILIALELIAQELTS